MAKKIGFIDNYLDEFHANNYPKWIDDKSKGELVVAYAYARQDAPSGMTTAQWCEKNKVEGCSTIEELVEKSDYIIVLSPDNPEFHEELCRLPLASGKRTYVDKTFAEDKASAQRIFENAEGHKTPCFSTSALRFAEEYKELPKDIIAISSRGPGAFSNYAIHQLEPIVALMGSGAKRIQHIGSRDFPAFVIEFDDGRRAIMAHHGWNIDFSMAITFSDGASREVIVKSDYFGKFVDELVDFFMTGSVKVSHDQTISVMALREAGVKALAKSGEWINV